MLRPQAQHGPPLPVTGPSGALCLCLSLGLCWLAPFCHPPPQALTISQPRALGLLREPRIPALMQPCSRADEAVTVTCLCKNQTCPQAVLNRCPLNESKDLGKVWLGRHLHKWKERRVHGFVVSLKWKQELLPCETGLPTHPGKPEPRLWADADPSQPALRRSRAAVFQSRPRCGVAFGS